MPKGTTFSNDTLLLILNATAIANIADNAASSPLTNLYLSLHTASPAGTSQQTSGSGWTVSSSVGSNTALAQFAQCGASGATITHVGIGTASSGTGKLLYQGALNSSLAVASGIQPQFAIGSLTISET
jgi:hypothetical protein